MPGDSETRSIAGCNRHVLRQRIQVGVFLFLIVPLGAVAIAGSAPPTTSKTRPAEFSASLFDGRTLQGWTIENDCEIGVEDGSLVLQSGNGWLRSDHTYADFALHVEWKALKESDYDAGIYIRTLNGGKDFPKDSYQINLLQGEEGNIKKLKGAASKGLIKPGDWNAFDIAVVGDQVALQINGKPAYKVGGLKQRIGYVGLQCEVIKGGKFQFRNLSITELGYRSLFDGKSLDGWTGAGEPAEKCWVVREGLLACTGAPGPWLRSGEQHGDFNLRLDYLVAAGGNSGVYVRVPEDGNHHRENETAPPAGFEVQILDDHDPQYRELKDYQFSGSVYDIAGANPCNVRPAGEWNTLEINAQGQHVTVTQNGVVVVDVNDQTHPLIKLRQTSGFLGLQNHSTQVTFRNLRVGAPQ
ncbi:MAG: DUF1080 domain-containing protein [Planctomycetaceae bacterium]|nr:DUF1080 domain-containing protein [Planctomycetaceae bacterium]